MSKLASSMVSEAVGATVFAGIDVSAATLAVAVQQQQGDGCRQKEFANSATGHRQLIAWLRKLGGLVRVSLEATGTYSLDVALALDAAEGIEGRGAEPEDDEPIRADAAPVQDRCRGHGCAGRVQPQDGVRRRARSRDDGAPVGRSQRPRSGASGVGQLGAQTNPHQSSRQ